MSGLDTSEVISKLSKFYELSEFTFKYERETKIKGVDFQTFPIHPLYTSLYDCAIMLLIRRKN